MKNIDILKMVDKTEIIDATINLILNLQEETINNEEITLKDQMAMIGTAVELNRISDLYPKIFQRYEDKANKLWDIWYQKNSEFLAKNFSSNPIQ